MPHPDGLLQKLQTTKSPSYTRMHCSDAIGQRPSERSPPLLSQSQLFSSVRPAGFKIHSQVHTCALKVLRTEGILGNVGNVGRVGAERLAETKRWGYFFLLCATIVITVSIQVSTQLHRNFVPMSKALILQVYDPLSYFLREHFHAVYKGDVCSITCSTLRMLPTTWWQLGGKQEGVLPCSRAL